MIQTHLPTDIFNVELDWPAVPDDVCNKLFEHVKSARDSWKENGLPSVFSQYEPPDYLVEWVRNNLPSIPKHFRIVVQATHGKILPVHIDSIRASAFNFVMTEDGGTTNWYDADNKLVHSTNYKTKVWYQHQSRVAHGVTNVSNGPRIAISIFEFEKQPENSLHVKSKR